MTGFVLFRVFDIWKPGAIRWAERRFTGGWGVMADDIMAGIHGDLLSHWEKGDLKIVGNRTFNFEEGGKAIEHIAAGRVEGKIVVRIQPRPHG